jgi:hypothetical protein
MLGCAGETSPTLANLPDTPGKSLQLEIYPSQDGKQPARSFNITNPQDVDAILNVLREGCQQTDHKCADLGSATITFTDEHTLTIPILPGHQSEHYEFRYQRNNYWVSRSAFFAVLEKAGVDMTAIPKG